MRTLAGDALSAPEMYELHKLLTLRSQLLTDAHDLRVKIINADEQLANLKLLSHPTSGLHQTGVAASSSAQPPSSSGVDVSCDRRSVFGSVSSLLSMPSSASPPSSSLHTTPQPPSSGASSGGGVVMHSKTPSSASSNGTLDSLESNHHVSSSSTAKISKSNNSLDDDNIIHTRQTSWSGQSATLSMSTDV